MRALRAIVTYLLVVLQGLTSDMLSLLAPFHDLLVRMWRRRWRSRRNRRRFPSLARPAFRELHVWTSRPGKNGDSLNQLLTFMT